MVWLRPSDGRILYCCTSKLNELFPKDRDDKIKFPLAKSLSGYRCHFHKISVKGVAGQNSKGTINHMGNALDLHFNKNGTRIMELKDMDSIRKDYCYKYMGAH